MRVLVNGEARELADDATVGALLATLGLEAGRRGFAVAVDAEVVPRGEWDARSLHEDARVEVVHAIQGG